MFTYTANIPQPGDNPAQSQDQILNNFQSINQANNVDHIDFNNNVDFGKSKYTHFKNAATTDIPVPSTTSDEGALYAKVENSDSQLFWRFKNNGTELQLTSSQLNITTTPGCTPLPGGMLMQWGNASVANNGSFNFFVPFTTVYSIQVSIVNNNDTGYFCKVKTLSTTGFTIGLNNQFGTVLGVAIPVYYIAVGLQ